MASSKLYKPYITLGLISNSVPSSFRLRGKALYVTTSVGKSFKVFSCQNLGLEFVGPIYSSRITSICHCGECVLVGLSDGTLSLCERGKEKCRTQLKTSSPIIHIEYMEACAIVVQSNNMLSFIDLSESFSVQYEINMFEGEEEYHIVSVVHPPTYLSKILIGTVDGNMHLFNVRTQCIIYTIKEYLGHSIKDIQNLSVIDLVAVAFSGGSVAIHNIREDSQVVMIKLSGFNGTIERVAVRTDGKPHIAVGTTNGDVVVYSLEEMVQISYIAGAHCRSIHSLCYYPGTSVLISVGSDNSMKEWSFEDFDNSYHLLKSLVGFQLSPSSLRYYDEEGHFILSSGLDRSLRLFSTRKNTQDLEFSQGSVSRLSKMRGVSEELVKLPTISSVSFSHFREKDWDNIATSHTNQNFVTTWSYETKSLGGKVLSSDGSIVRSVFVSNCGNFVLLGTDSGVIDTYNIQSHKLKFSISKAHTSPIVRLFLTANNQILVSISADGIIKFWEYLAKTEVGTIVEDNNIVHSDFHKESNMMAVAYDNFRIKIYDIETRRVMRIFVGHRNTITSLKFTLDSKWIISCSMDRTVKTWDISSGHLIDSLNTETIPKDAELSPMRDFLAVIKSEELGIDLMINTANYNPATLNEEFRDSEHGIADGDQNNDLYENTFKLLDISTMSWQKILNYDLIKDRNKPKARLERPERLPFFLESKMFGDRKETNDHKGNTRTEGKDSDPNPKGNDMCTTEFHEMLDENDFTGIHNFIRTKNPVLIDFEIRFLSEKPHIIAFLRYLKHQISLRRDFDMNQVYLNIFFRNNRALEMFRNDSEVREEVSSLKDIQVATWGLLEDGFQKSICLLDIIKSR